MISYCKALAVQVVGISAYELLLLLVSGVVDRPGIQSGFPSD